MEKEEATTSKGFYGGERGAGGKLRKPLLRKPPSTPYDRSQPKTQIQQSKNGGGWLSKLVDPATRIISVGANRIFPSFISKTLFGADSDHYGVEAKDADDENPEHISDIQISRSPEGGHGLAKSDRLEMGSDIDRSVGDKLDNSSDGSSFSDIEQMLKEKTFSRHDLNRLTELLHSRIADPSDACEESKKKPDITTGAEATGGSSAQENLKMLGEVKREEYSDIVKGATPTARLQSSVRDQVGASPIDIAKAYMGGRTSELRRGSQSVILGDERTPLHTDGFSPKSSIPSPTPKTSVCWPGAMVQDQRAYQTPQTQKHRVGLHNLPRTPYSRPANSRSISKLHDGGGRSINITPNQWRQSYTPNFNFSQVTKSRSSLDNAAFRSVGPIRRSHNKFVEATPTRGAGPNMFEISDASKGLLPISNQNQETGPSRNGNTKFQTTDNKPLSSSAGVSTVHPHSTEIARRILEHLDRTIPTPQKKADELKIATSWRKPSSSEFATGTPNGQSNEQPHVLEVSDAQKNRITVQQFSSKGKEIAHSSLFEAQPVQKKIDVATSDAVKTNAFASNTVPNMSGFGGGMDSNATTPSMDFEKTQTSHEVTNGQAYDKLSEKNQSLPPYNHKDIAGSHTLNIQKKPPTPHTFGSKKPALSSITITKHNLKSTVSFDNGSGFTFPVSAASSGNISEPPTPSILPFPSASGMPRPQEKLTEPTKNLGLNATDELLYSFRSKSTEDALVFSFPSTISSTPSGDDVSAKPTFKFGSDKNDRISFRSVGEIPNVV